MSDYTPDFDDEAELQEWLTDQFNDAGYVAEREVSPRGENYRADVIVKGGGYPPIGIETKHMATSDSAGAFAEALEQIAARYRSKKYANFGTVDLWAVCPYFTSSYQDSDATTTAKFIREFFNWFGIGYIDLSRWGLFIDFGYSSSDKKILVKDISPYDHNEIQQKKKYGDAKTIAESVGPKLNRLPIDRGKYE